MVSLEQIRALEARVEKAVVLIDKLRRENAGLEQRLIEASRSEEQVKTAYFELESRTAVASRMTSESEARLSELGAGLKAAEDKARDAELKAAEAEERAAVLERRALAAEHKASELESKAEEIKREQSRIEEGLTHALQKLDAFEDLVMGISVGNAGVNAESLESVPEDAKADGDEMAEAVEESLPALEPQDSPFLGAPSTGGPFSGEPFRGTDSQGDSSRGDEHELDIF